jgi:pyridoxine 4-dehydrogenase
METFLLGNLSVHRIGFGAMQLPGRGVMGPPRDREEALSNELIRAALYPYPENLVLVSKVGAFRDERGGWIPGQRPEQLRSGVEDNLRSLGVGQLGAVNLRLMEHPSALPVDQKVSLEDQLAEMVALRDEGKIAGIGISTADRAQVEQGIAQAGIVCVQNAFSLLDQKDADVLDLCHERGIAYTPFFPLGSAFPGSPKVQSNAAIQAVAERIGALPAQVGLAWLLAHRDNILLIPGTSRVAHLEQNLAAGEVVLSAVDIAELEGTVA